MGSETEDDDKAAKKPIQQQSHSSTTISAEQVDLTKPDSLNYIGNDEYDWIIVSHVIEHIAKNNINETKILRMEILKNMIRIAKKGFVLTSPLISIGDRNDHIIFLGHKRVAFVDDMSQYLVNAGLTDFNVNFNSNDQCFTIFSKL